MISNSCASRGHEFLFSWSGLSHNSMCYDVPLSNMKFFVFGKTVYCNVASKLVTDPTKPLDVVRNEDLSLGRALYMFKSGMYLPISLIQSFSSSNNTCHLWVTLHITEPVVPRFSKKCGLRINGNSIAPLLLLEFSSCVCRSWFSSLL